MSLGEGRENLDRRLDLKILGCFSRRKKWRKKNKKKCKG
jgi:hypothetical protein